MQPETLAQDYPVGALVQYFYDTGAFGLALLYGRVIASGPTMVTVQWESGLRNRLRRDGSLRRIKPAEDQTEAQQSIAQAIANGKL